MSAKQKLTILLGGIGGDSHSVGLSILRQALSDRYQVFYLGTQNPLDSFFEYAPLCNAVMVSCMDGHAQRYLTQFPEMLRVRPNMQNNWYLGGNLTIGDGVGCEEMFLRMGFKGVFPKFVDLQVVLDLLERDFHGAKPVQNNTEIWHRARDVYVTAFVDQSEDKIAVEAFEKMRKDVLPTWKTGQAAKDLMENAAFLKDQPSFSASTAQGT